MNSTELDPDELLEVVNPNPDDLAIEIVHPDTPPGHAAVFVLTPGLNHVPRWIAAQLSKGTN